MFPRLLNIGGTVKTVDFEYNTTVSYNRQNLRETVELRGAHPVLGLDMGSMRRTSPGGKITCSAGSRYINSLGPKNFDSRIR